MVLKIFLFVCAFFIDVPMKFYVCMSFYIYLLLDMNIITQKCLRVTIWFSCFVMCLVCINYLPL